MEKNLAGDVIAKYDRSGNIEREYDAYGKLKQLVLYDDANNPIYRDKGEIKEYLVYLDQGQVEKYISTGNSTTLLRYNAHELTATLNNVEVPSTILGLIKNIKENKL